MRSIAMLVAGLFVVCASSVSAEHRARDDEYESHWNDFVRCAHDYRALQQTVTQAVPMNDGRTVCEVAGLSIKCAFNSSHVAQWQANCVQRGGRACPRQGVFEYRNGTVKSALEEFVCVPASCSEHARNLSLAATVMLSWLLHADELQAVNYTECGASADSEHVTFFLLKHAWVVPVVLGAVSAGFVLAGVLLLCAIIAVVGLIVYCCRRHHHFLCNWHPRSNNVDHLLSTGAAPHVQPMQFVPVGQPPVTPAAPHSWGLPSSHSTAPAPNSSNGQSSAARL